MDLEKEKATLSKVVNMTTKIKEQNTADLTAGGGHILGARIWVRFAERFVEQDGLAVEVRHGVKVRCIGLALIDHRPLYLYQSRLQAIQEDTLGRLYYVQGLL